MMGMQAIPGLRIETVKGALRKSYQMLDQLRTIVVSGYGEAGVR